MSTDPSQPKKDSQNDFWDLGDDDLDLDGALEEVRDDQREGAAEAVGAEVVEELSPPEPAVDPASEDGVNSAETMPEETQPTLVRKKDGWTEEKKEQPPLSFIEKISLVAVVACLLGAAAWVVSTFYRDAPQGKLITFNEDYPAKGNKVSIEEVETWWREPIRTGKDADVGVVVGSNLIPCARIKISEGSSTSLRVTFRDSDQQLVGDTINLLIENGKFVETGSEEISIHSTAGFENPSRINSYDNEDINPWSLAIIEEDSDDNDPLVKARISADFKSN